MTRLFLLVQFLAVSGRVVRIETPNDFQYMYLEDHGITVKGYNNITFLLRAANDGHIALSRYINNWNTNSYEVVIGGWKNHRSAIRRCDQCEAKVTVEHNILREEELLPFWISWAQGHIRVGSGTQLHKQQFLSWTDSDPDQISHVGVSTGWGANGTWIFGAVDGGWSAWSSWSECSTSCEGGTRTRKRYCNNPQPVYGAECTGMWLQEGICNDVPCAVDGGWNTWGVFGTCSLSCGDGVRVRVRSCDDPPPQNDGSPCEGPEEQTTPCKLKECPVDGSWSEWTPWSSCTKSCGTGEITRRRLCDRPPPQHNGRRCNGSAIESKTCMVVNCPVDGGWSEWSSWSNCSVTCGDGVLSRSRDCNRPIPAYGGANCSGPERDEATCNEAPCPVPGGWSRWSVWEPCTLTCGGGNRSRIRFCDDPPPQYGAPHCAGADIDTSTCNNFPCPVNGGWTSWGSWTACSSSCGIGQYSRTRRCSNPSPNYGGARCRGPSFQQERCVDTKCPVDGTWSEWSSWSMCSHTCGPGHVQRSRVCDNPEPRFDGLNCSGEWLEVEECLLEECPVDGGWTDWSPWSQCSATCGPGHMTSARWCIFPRPAHGGRSCDGPAVNETQCMDDYCPIDGGWSSWGPWDTCTASCEGGTRVRYRTCTSPPPQYSGRDCLGVSLINETCNIQRCPVPIGWSPWGTWTECSVTCGGGYMARVRECEDPNAFNCVGSDVQNWTCSFVDCPDKWVYEPPDEPVEAPGAVGIGVMSIVFMAFIPAICILIDLISLPAHIRYARRNIKDFKKTLLLLRARWQNREVQYYTAGSRTSSTNRRAPQPSPIAHSSGTANGSTLGLTAGNGGGSAGGSPDSSVPGSPGSEPPDYDNEGLDVDDIIVGDGVDVGHDVIAGHVTPPRRRHDVIKHGGGGSSPTVVGNHVDVSPSLNTAAIGNHVGVKRAEANHVSATSHDRYDLTPGRDAGTMTQY